MKNNKMKKMKDVYLNNKSRRYNEIIEVKDFNANLISNPKETIIMNKYKIIIAALVILGLLISTMYKDLPIFFITLAFLIGICLIITYFNAFKMTCTEKGMQISFGFQHVFFSYDKIKCIYLSRYDSYSFFTFSKDYSIIIKYIDNNNYIKELSFSALFVKPKQIEDFLNNFIIENNNSSEVLKFEKFKLVKKIFKTVIYIGIIIAIILSYFYK